LPSAIVLQSSIFISTQEKELSDILDKNTELAIANSDMQHQIVELEQVDFVLKILLLDIAF